MILKLYARKCSQCSKGMNEGYMIDNGEAYFCSEKCLNENMTTEEFNELYDNGNSDTFYTEWEGNEGLDEEDILKIKDLVEDLIDDDVEVQE